MKKILSTILLLLSAVVASAQTIYVCKDGSYTTRELSEYLEINPAEADSITFQEPQFGAPTVKIQFWYDHVDVTIPNWASHITATVNGTDVIIDNTQTSGDETTYIVSGDCSDGSLRINGSYKMTLCLEGLTLSSSKNAAIDIQCGKRTDLILNKNFANNIATLSGSTGKAALYCKGHMEIKGEGGSLNIKSSTNHGIATKEYLEVKDNCHLRIESTANDAIHVGQYFSMSTGDIWIDNTVRGDGIQVDATTDPLDENNGQILIKGGSIVATISQQDCKGMKAESNISITGGNIVVYANGNGSRGIQTDGNMVIDQTENHATSISITAAGDKCTLPECADDPHKCTGIKADGNLTINNGVVNVYNTGKKAKGIKIGGIYTKNGGTVNAIIEDATGAK